MTPRETAQEILDQLCDHAYTCEQAATKLGLTDIASHFRHLGESALITRGFVEKLKNPTEGNDV
jgi:hypothetical protein